MFPSRLALAKATENAGASAGGVCPTFQAKLKLFAPAAVGTASVQLSEITGQTFEVTNASTKGITEGQEIIVGQTVDERWIVFPTSEAHPRIQFVTTAKIGYGTVTARVLRVHHDAPNLLTGSPLQYGDTVILNDPFNLWQEIEPGATGWAYLAYEQSDLQPDINKVRQTVQGQSEVVNESHVARYEIEECSLPVNELQVQLKSCLTPTMSGGYGVIIGNDFTGKLRSSYNNVDRPPAGEWTFTPQSGECDQYIQIAFSNPHDLDGIAGSTAVLRRIQNSLDTSNPENYDTSQNTTLPPPAWEVVLVSEKVARWAQVRYTQNSAGEGSGDWEFEEFFDGFDPRDADSNCPFDGPCEPAVSCEFCECLVDGDQGYAFYSGEFLNYKVVSTNSAFYGQGVKEHIVQKVAFDGCDLNYTRIKARVFCAEEPYVLTTSIAGEPVQVLAGGELAIHSSAPACSSGCTWTLVEEDCDADAMYVVVEGPPKAWEELTACAPGCEANTDDLPDADKFEVGNQVPVSCKKLVWKQTAGCASFCSCETPAAVTNGTVTGFVKGAVLQTDCESTYPEEGGVFLCWSYTVKTIYTLPCQDEDLLNPIPGGQSCIPLTDCPEEEESGGGGTP